MFFLDKIKENTKKYPDKIILRSKKVIGGVTYAQLEERSGKIYNWLKSHNIGKEDVVMICMPRGVRIPICVIGVLKAGAAFVIVESNYPKERIEFIKKDSDSKIVIDENLFFEIMDYDYLEGYNESDKHDACFVVYTSGTTGNPKGILHEYGKIQLIVDTVFQNFKETPDPATFAFGSSFSFAAFELIFLCAIYNNKCFFAIENEIMKNPRMLCEVYNKYNVTDTFFTPSLVRIIKDMPKNLVNVIVAGELCNGIYVEGVNLINLYGSSETAFFISAFVIDKKYERTPIGKGSCGIDLLILDEDGRILPDGEIGEICLKNEYTRGYLNLPKKTKEVFIDGIYHMGDMGYKGKDGNYYICGRKDDMIKINGNRVEPAEIEAVVCREYNIKNVIAKGFLDDNNAFIVLYYVNSEAKSIFSDINSVRAKLSDCLPYYMVPTYFIGLDKMPLNANGKVDKKSLVKPNLEEMRGSYEPPISDMEKQICKRMEKVLGINNIGRNEDFFILGGDSLHAINLVKECNDLKLNSSDVYKYRTVAKIANYLESRIDSDDVEYLEKQNELAKQKIQGMLPEQILIIDQSFYKPKSCMWNLPILMKLKNDTDVLRFKKAVIKVLSHHPVFSTKIKTDEFGNFVQYYDSKVNIDIETIIMSDAEFEKTKDNLVKYFKLYNALLYRANFYKTESSTYFFIDMHHLICDGISITILMKQIYQCYTDENYILPIDYYYLHVEDYINAYEQASIDNEKYKYEKLYSKYKGLDTWEGILKQDSQSLEFKAGDVDYSLNLKSEVKNKNEFFITAIAIAMLKFNNEDHALIRWTYNNRNNNDKNNIVGLLYNNLPIALKIDESTKKENLIEQVKQQIEFSIINWRYLYAYEHPIQFNNSPIVVYQKGTTSFGELANLLEWEETLFDKIKHSNEVLVVDVFEEEKEVDFRLHFHYSKSNYELSSIKRFYELIVEAVGYLEKV